MQTILNQRIKPYAFYIRVILFNKNDYKTLRRSLGIGMSDEEISKAEGLYWGKNTYLNICINIDYGINMKIIDHELVHLVWDLHELCGVKGDECFAYQFSELKDEVCKSLKIKFKIPQKLKSV